MTDKAKSKARQDRLAQALRRNLERRKAQARERGAAAEEERTAEADPAAWRHPESDEPSSR
jgi:hypothetical protein